MGRLIRPPGVPKVRDFVLVGREPGGTGRTIRCVVRGGCGAPGRLGFGMGTPTRGIDIGCVVTVPDGLTEEGGKPAEEGVKPGECGGLTAGMVARKDSVGGGV